MLRDIFPTLDPTHLGKVLLDCEWDTTTTAERLLDETQLPPSGVLLPTLHRPVSANEVVPTSLTTASSSGTSSQGGTLTPPLFEFKGDLSS